MSKEKVNIFITNRSGEGSIPLWRNISKESASELPPAFARGLPAERVKLCSREETQGSNFFLCWSYSSSLGLHSPPPKIDDGRFDRLLEEILTEEDKKTIQFWDGKNWRNKF